VVASFFLTSSFGIIYSYSDFFLPLSSQFNWSHAVVSTVPGVALLVFSVGAVIGGYVTDRLSFRKLAFIGTVLIGVGTGLASQVQNFPALLVLFGLLTPLGTSFVVIVATAAPVRWFVKKRGLAVGIMAAGSGLGTLIVPPLIERLIQSEGWREGFMVMGLGYLVLLAVCSSFIQTPEERKEKPYGWHEMNEEERSHLVNQTWEEALSKRAFWQIYVMFFVGSFGATMFLVHVIPFADTVGISQLDASIGLGAFGAGSLLARVAMGLVADRLGRSATVVISFIVQVISLALLALSSSSLIILFYACAFGIGFGYGGYLSDFIALSGDLFGMKWIQRIWAIDETAYGIAGLISPIVAGILFDSFDNYYLVFGIGTVLALLGLGIAINFSMQMRKVTSRIVIG
jgi:OFA family oxalate/formate antiporter-like MFS transporter